MPDTVGEHGSAKWWAVAARLLGALSLAAAGFATSGWLGFVRDGTGFRGLFEGVFFAFCSAVVLGLAIRASVKSKHAEPRPRVWYEAVFGPKDSRQGR